MNEMEEIKTAKEASITKVRDAGRSLIVTEGDLDTVIEICGYGPMADVKHVVAKVVAKGVKEYEQVLLAGESDSGSVNLSFIEQDLIRGAIITAAANGHPIVDLALLLVREFKEVNRS